MSICWIDDDIDIIEPVSNLHVGKTFLTKHIIQCAEERYWRALLAVEKPKPSGDGLLGLLVARLLEAGWFLEPEDTWLSRLRRLAFEETHISSLHQLASQRSWAKLYRAYANLHPSEMRAANYYRDHRALARTRPGKASNNDDVTDNLPNALSIASGKWLRCRKKHDQCASLSPLAWWPLAPATPIKKFC